MEKREDTLLDGQFRFKTLPDGNMDKAKTVADFFLGGGALNLPNQVESATPEHKY